jgi:hypothetical protein
MGTELARLSEIPATNIAGYSRANFLYDKFLCDKFYLLVCTCNFDSFFYDKGTCSKASMLAFEQVHLP